MAVTADAKITQIYEGTNQIQRASRASVSPY
jgi:alkylation response protein AidB-like acyl-CoA dehydrogenase